MYRYNTIIYNQKHLESNIYTNLKKFLCFIWIIRCICNIPHDNVCIAEVNNDKSRSFKLLHTDFRRFHTANLNKCKYPFQIPGEPIFGTFWYVVGFKSMN